jgi:signal transduction histidine kinase
VGATVVLTTTALALPVASKGPARRAVAALALSISTLLIGDGLARLAAAGDLGAEAAVGYAVRGIGASFLPPSFLLFATTLAPPRVARWALAAAAVAFVLCAAIAVVRTTTNLFSAEVRVVDHMLMVVAGDLRTAIRLVYLAVLASAVFLFFLGARGATLARTRREAQLAALAAALPVLAELVTLALPGDGRLPVLEPQAFALPAAFMPVFVMVVRREVPASSVSDIRSMFHAMADPILVVGPPMTVTFANDAARRLLTSPAGQVEGAHIGPALRSPAFGEAESSRLAGAIEEVVSGRASHLELETKTQPPNEFHFAVSVLAAGSHGAEGGPDRPAAVRPQEPQTALVLFRDETEIRMKGIQLAKANEAKDLFISMFSHDLKAPLNAISGFSELVALDSQSTPEALAVYRYSMQIRDAASQIQLMMDNARVFSRMMDSPQGDPLREPLDVAAILRREAANLARPADLKGMKIQVDVQAADDQVTVSGSPILRNVFLNLLDNAIKYGPRGSTITVTLRSYGEVVEVDVADEGPGIPPNMREAVFKKYTRLEQTRRGAEGVGIGLSIVRGIVTIHGGTVLVQDRPDGKSGAVFVVRLPRRPG